MYIFGNLTEWRDGSSTFYPNDPESVSEDAYVGYTTDTRYMDGATDGTYWNTRLELPDDFELQGNRPLQCDANSTTWYYL
jgi:hypothetical protein